MHFICFISLSQAEREREKKPVSTCDVRRGWRRKKRLPAVRLSNRPSVRPAYVFSMLHIGATSPPLADIGADFVLSADSKELRRAGLMPQIFEKNGPFIWGDTLHYSCCAFWEMRREGNRDKDMELLYFLPAVNGFLLHEGKFIFGPLLAVVCVCVCVTKYHSYFIPHLLLL